MNVIVKQISSLHKIRSSGVGALSSLSRKILMGGQSFNYQIALETPDDNEFRVSLSSPLAEYISIYTVKNVVMDLPSALGTDDDYITKEPGIMPDLLVPIEDEGNMIRVKMGAAALWVRVNIPQDTPAGSYAVTVKLTREAAYEAYEITQTLYLDVISASLPAQTTMFTQWFHVDCIADAHQVPIYSEAHWNLIDKYMALAAEGGINMLLTPVITPPLDTGVGLTRPCTQLTDIEKVGDTYRFDFTRLERWVELCNKNGIRYFEISHLFSQWGLKYTPNIRVRENGEESYLFGWHMDAKDPEYRNFLSQFLPALLDFFRSKDALDRCYFHISDEPSEAHLDAYQYAYDLIKSLIGDCPTLDALSKYAFYERGLVPNPVTATNHIETFLEHKLENQWAYYCCSQGHKVGNRFLAMPSYRNRILGLQLYKYNIKGFLQWGYNFYYNQYSRKKINPYLTTSSEMAFPSGDAFTVYPATDKPLPSLRLWVFKEALEDIAVCRKLESYIGHDKVVALIDEAAGRNLTFSDYPRNTAFIPNLMEKMLGMIKEYAKQ